VRRQRGDRKRPQCAACGFVHYENPVPGVAVVAFVETEVVLVRSGQEGYLHGQWCFPCGHVEYDEHPRIAAAREMFEETGLVTEVGEVLHTDLNFLEPWGRNSLGIWFAGAVTGGELRAGSDALEARTFPLTALPDRLCYKSDMRVLHKLCEERGAPPPPFPRYD
jgi:ADP-ribose pyrophosphatase YjhB (NUDIX family)